MGNDQATAGDLVSVVMPCCGQLEYTRLSVPRLLRYSRHPFELIFIDLASLDGTNEFLAGVAAAASVPVETVRAGSESAFAATAQEALTTARGQLIVWMTNDVLVTEHWVHQLVALALTHPMIGMVGPMANVGPGPQRVEKIPYRLERRKNPWQTEAGRPQEALDTTPVDAFAQEWHKSNQGRWTEQERLGGFCVLLRRDLLATVPLFSESTEAGTIDWDHYCVRVRQAGFRLVCCRDLYVHHFGSWLVRP